MSILWRGYQQLLVTRPRLAQAINTSLLFGSGDIIAQVALERRQTAQTYDFLRTARYFGVGFFIAGPVMQVWYTHIDKIAKARKAFAVPKMVALDQLIFLPVYLASFIGIMSVLRQEPPSVLNQKMQRDYSHLLLTSYKFWPAVQMVNFYCVPLHHRILVMNCVSIVWNTYVGWKAESILRLTVELMTDENTRLVYRKYRGDIGLELDFSMFSKIFYSSDCSGDSILDFQWAYFRF